MALYECGGHHLSTTPGTCYVNGCFRKLKPVEKPSTAAKERGKSDWLTVHNLEAYVEMQRGKFHRTLPNYRHQDGKYRNQDGWL